MMDLVRVFRSMASAGYWVRSSCSSNDRWIDAVKSVYGLKFMNSITMLGYVGLIKD